MTKSDSDDNHERDSSSNVSPIISPETINSMLAISHRAHEIIGAQQISHNTALFNSFRRTFEDIHRFTGLHQQLSGHIQLARSPIARMTIAANQSLNTLVDSSTIASVMEAARRANALSPYWTRQFQASRFTETQSSGIQNLLVRAHMADVVRISVLAQTTISQYSSSQLFNSLSQFQSDQARLRESVVGMTNSYSAFLRSLEDQPSLIASRSAVFSRSPAIELFSEANVVRTFSDTDDEDEDLTTERLATQQGLENESRLIELLSRLDEGLPRMLDGARNSLSSANPDRIRHAATSLRELFTHVIHILAPDDEVREWTDDETHFHNNRPTRKARLGFICKEINHGAFLSFVEKDINALTELIQLFQRGTHGVTIPFTEEQIQALYFRTESALTYLIEIRFND